MLPPNPERRTAGLDLLGITTLSTSLLLVVVPLILGRAQRWPTWTWLCLAASLPAFALFWRGQQRTAGGGNPLIKTEVVGRARVILGLLAPADRHRDLHRAAVTLAQYFQQGLGRSALASGLVLVPWVAAFGLAGQVTRRLPTRLGPTLPRAGNLLLAAAYLTISAAVHTGPADDAVLVVLLGVGGFGLGTGFATLIGHLTNAVPPATPPTSVASPPPPCRSAGPSGVAAFGSLYLALAAHPGASEASYAFALTSISLGAAALIAAVTAYQTTHVRHDATPEPHPVI